MQSWKETQIISSKGPQNYGAGYVQGDSSLGSDPWYWSNGLRVGREGRDLLGALWPEHVFLINCQGVLLNYLHSAEVRDAGETASLSSFITKELACDPYLFTADAFILWWWNHILIHSADAVLLILGDENQISATA